MGKAHEHNWTIGIGSARFGFDQYRQYQDAGGRNLYNFSDVTTKAVASPRYTTVYGGPLVFTVRGPAWLVASVVAVSIASLLFVVTAGVGRIRSYLTDAHNAAS